MTCNAIRRTAIALVLAPLAVLGGLAVTATTAEAALPAAAAGGTVYVLQADHRVVKVAPNGSVSTFTTASAPGDIATDAAGELYIADGNNVIIQDTEGSLRAEYGFQGTVRAVAATSDGRLYVSTGNDVILMAPNVLRPLGISGVVDLAVSGDDTVYAARGTDVDGLVKIAPDGTTSKVEVTTALNLTRISYPTALATTPGSRDLWVSDANQLIGPNAGRVLQLSGSTPENVYPGSPTQIAPTIAVDGAGGLITWDSANQRLVDTDPTGTQTVVAGGISQPVAIAVVPTNLAAGHLTAASSSVENASWSTRYLTDGNRRSMLDDNGYSSAGATTAAHPESLTFDLGHRRSLTAVTLFPRVQIDGTEPAGVQGAGFPATVQFTVSDDGSSWRPAGTFSGQSADDGLPRSYLLPADTTARYVQVTAQVLGRLAPGDSLYRLQLAELQLWGSPVAPSTITGFANEVKPNVPFSFSYGSDADPAATFSVTGGALPTGLSLSPSGTLSGTTTAAAGTYHFTITARNAAGFTSMEEALFVSAPAAITGDPVDGSVGSTYNWSFGRAGYPTPTFVVTSGALPAGLSLNAATGAITGMPTKAGQTTLTVMAISVPGNMASRTVTMTVTPGASGQLINTGTPGSVQPGAWENSQDMRIFAERQNQVLASSLTVGGSTIAAGTKVNVYYVHADPVGTANVLTHYYGVAQFGEQVLGMATTGADLQATTALFGNPTTTAYATTPDQGLESPDSVSTAGGTVTMDLSVYSGTDAMRIITLAP